MTRPNTESEGRFVNTGSALLDQDAAVVDAVLGSAATRRIRNAASRRDVSTPELLAAVPESLVRFAALVGDAEFLDTIVEKLSDEDSRKVKGLARKLRDRLPELLEHPVVIERIRRSQQEDSEATGARGERDESVEPLARQLLKEVTGLSPVYSFVVAEDDSEVLSLRPTVRLALSNRSGKLLLDTTLDLRDAAWMSRTVLSVFARLLQHVNRIDGGGTAAVEVSETEVDYFDESLAEVDLTVQNLREQVALTRRRYGEVSETPKTNDADQLM